MNTNQELITQIQDKKIQVVLREVSNQGKTRCIDFLVIDGERLNSISHLIAPVLNLKRSTKHMGLIVKGCGMDMAFSCLYDLFSALGLDTSNVSYNAI